MDVVTKKFRYYGCEVLLHVPYSPDWVHRLPLNTKVKKTLCVDVFLLWKSFLPTVPELFDTWIQGLDKKQWKQFDSSSEMALFTGTQHLCTFSIVAAFYLSAFAKCLEGVVHHQRLHLYWRSVFTSYGMDKFMSCVAPGPSSGSLTLAKRSQSHGFISGECGGCSRISHCQRRKRFVTAAVVCDSLHCHEEWWGSVPPSVPTCFTQSLKTFLCTMTSCLFIQERCSSFVNMVLVCSHCPYENQRSTHCSR